MIKCEECGQMISDRAEYCPNCGAPVIKKTVCTECGAVIPDGAKVCPNCGAPVKGKKQEVLTPVSEGKEQRVQRFLVMNRKYLPIDKIDDLREQLSVLSPEQMDTVECFFEYEEPTNMFVLSLVLGFIGIDRSWLGQPGLGLLKFFLCGCIIGLIIWYPIDISNIYKRTKNYNYEQLQRALRYV